VVVQTLVKDYPSKRKLSALKVAPFGISVLLFLVAELVNIRVETIQPNGLPEIQYPYGAYSFLMHWLALGFLVFGVALNLAVRGGRLPVRPLLGSGLLALGLTVTPLAALVFWADEGDYEQRCISVSCQPFVQKYSLEVIVLSIIAIGGLISVGLGSWFLTHSHRRGTEMEPRERSRSEIKSSGKLVAER
jgi:hypothetical protein